MILGFKQIFPWGQPTLFREKILLAVGMSSISYIPKESLEDLEERMKRQMKTMIFPKLHSIRSGNRWKPGMIIHMAYGVRTKKYEQFNKGIAELSLVKAVQPITIYADIKEVWVDNGTDAKKLSSREVETLAKNDGFDSVTDFWKWFTTDVRGQIIFFTEVKYLYGRNN